MQCDCKTLYAGAIGSAHRARNYASRHDGHIHVRVNLNRALNVALRAVQPKGRRGSLCSAIACGSMLTPLDLLIAHGATLRVLMGTFVFV